MKGYFITNDIVVDPRFIKVLATVNNDEWQRADWTLRLNIAPQCGAITDSAVVYVSTCSDPVYVGMLGENFWFHLDEEKGIDCLMEFGFIGETESEAFDFVNELMSAAGIVWRL